MKKTITATLSLLLALVCLLSFTACNIASGDPWATAKYKTDMTFGDGAKTIVVEVAAGERSVTFTVNTDEETVGAALLKEGLLEGEDGDYGLYIKKVNGMLADYNVDQTYWAFYINGEYAMTGLDMTEIDESAVYKLERTK